VVSKPLWTAMAGPSTRWQEDRKKEGRVSPRLAAATSDRRERPGRLTFIDAGGRHRGGEPGQCVAGVEPGGFWIVRGANALLHFARWWIQHHPSRTVQEWMSPTCSIMSVINSGDPKPTPQTINHRLGVLRSLYRFHAGQPLPAGFYWFQHSYLTRSPLGYCRPHSLEGSQCRTDGRWTHPRERRLSP
jgi:hypothetical protein